MMTRDSSFADDLRRFGPGAEPVGPEASRRYCRRLARRHYENFTVASFLLPRRLRQPFTNLYSYCRWADDLADETTGPDQSLPLLEWWEEQLDACYQGRVSHPVFVALAETIRQFDLPREPLADLLVAFRQDQTTTRYETFDQLLGYCRYSANPVGRLVLRLGRSYDSSRAELSDSICTGLQLANFWQDVACDWQRGRVYLPADWRLRFGYDDSCLERRECNDAFRRMMTELVADAEDRLRQGQSLADQVEPELRLAVSLFIGGGLAVLDAIRRHNYDTWSTRPVVGKWKKAVLLFNAWRRKG